MRTWIIIIALLLIVDVSSPQVVRAQEWFDSYNPVDNRFKTDLILRTTFGPLIVSNRCIFEWQNMDADPRSRYRNRTQIEHPMMFFHHKFTPYLAGEFIYNIHDNGFDEQRNVFGISKKIGSRVRTSL